jgi:putative spermidine/putrescine transport system ATP-binding protein
MSGAILIEALSASYGATKVLNGLDLTVEPGEFVALLGPSGCGKTTLLRAIAGFVPVRSGRILADGADITQLPAERRGTAMVFQSYALWPHMTVAQNVGYGLRIRGAPRAHIAARVTEILALLGLSGLGARKPAELSGGQRQRVALGRALAIDPAFLLLDEPLSSLDARIREELRHEIRALQKRLGITTVHVTHDREEAMVMADRIAVLDKGRLAQIGTPKELYHRPASAFVARFMGASNEIRVARGEGGALLPADAAKAGKILLFRPDAAALSRDHVMFRGDGTHLHGRVTQAAYLGRYWRHGIDLGGAVIMVDHADRIEPDTPVSVSLGSHDAFVFDEAGAVH